MSKLAGKSPECSQPFQGNFKRKDQLELRSQRRPLIRNPTGRTQNKMQTVLDGLNIPLTVAWTPNPDQDKHGFVELGSGTLFLFDESEEEAWQTLLHEILEWKLRDVTKVYRETINGLIEIIEKLSYKEKEKFLELVPVVFKLVDRSRKTGSLQNSRRPGTRARSNPRSQ